MVPPMSSTDACSAENDDRMEALPSSVIERLRRQKLWYAKGTKIHKIFKDPDSGEERLYEGIIQYLWEEDDYVYHILYEDGDREDLYPYEIAPLLCVDENTASLTPPRKKTKTTVGSARNKRKTLAPAQASSAQKKSKKARSADSTDDDDDSYQEVRPSSGRPQRQNVIKKRVNYCVDDTESDDYDTESEQETTRARRTSSSKRKVAKSSRPLKKSKDDDDDEASIVSLTNSDDDELDEDILEVKDDNDEEEKEAPQSRGSKKPATAAAKKGAASGGGGGKKMSESFQPMNAPSYPKLSLAQIAKEKEYLDPCGMEATDDIIGRLVGDQVDKIGGLLERALTGEDQDVKDFAFDRVGSKEVPLTLGTACSGTDAPSLALKLVEEQLELRGKSFFSHKHEFSCENDPAKQAYLARNFDSTLYPDIARLVSRGDDAFVPIDVFGQEKPIPPCRMFVAGTSCKNFSMMRSTRRIDLEDRGCSGETFFAAVEYLHVKQPSLAIFENVIGAPWGKMSEYITGRVKLSDCASTKAISGLKQSDKKKELVFSRESNGKIVVEQVPPFYGVMCGAVVKGFLRGDSDEIVDVKWPWPTSKLQNKARALSELMKANGISKANDTIVFETPCVYCTKLCKVDTKEFGLPQTRMRTYMFVWRPENDEFTDDLGEYWEEIVKHLKSPVRHSLDAFMLDDDHEVIRVFREALNGPPGRMSKRGFFLAPDFWTSASANLPHNVNTRKNLGLADKARWITNWGAYGLKQVPPSMWLEYLNCCSQRSLDMIDVLHASGIRDAESHDGLFCGYFWNLSQNVSKEKHRAACPGIASCITPGGDVFIPHRGRPLLGCEKLLIQGIPYFRLLLGNESEVQLGDLAGNAMSLTVVCATMLAAITCKQLRSESQSSGIPPGKILSQSIFSLQNKLSLRPALESNRASPNDDFDSAFSLFQELAGLADEAISSSILCTCESSGKQSLSESFLECCTCRVSCCRNCVSQVAGYNMSTHKTNETFLLMNERRSGTFLCKLRSMLPPSLMIPDKGWDEIVGLGEDRFRAGYLRGLPFELHKIKRDRRKWVAVYRARETDGEAKAELRVVIGELKTEERLSGNTAAFGLLAEIKSFIPALAEPKEYGALEPCAKMIIMKHEHHKESWFGNSPEKTARLFVEGTGSTPSLRSEVGLLESVAEDIEEAVKDKPDSRSAKMRGEERRWLYPKGWKSWPSKIRIEMKDGDRDSINVSGDYHRTACRQTTNQSALWIREGAPSLYLLLRPNINRSGPDAAIISSSMDYKDMSAVKVVFPIEWQPSDAFAAKSVNVVRKCWVPLPGMSCVVPLSTRVKAVAGDTNSDDFVSIEGLSESQVDLLCRGREGAQVRLKVENGQEAQQVVRAFNLICVSPILQLAAGSGLKYDLSTKASWNPIYPSSTPFGRCTKVVPVPPSERWRVNEDRSKAEKRKVWERSSDPGAARKYQLELARAPQPFEIWLDRKAGSLTVKCFPEVAAHHAASHLIRGRGQETEMDKNLSVAFKVSDISLQSDPVITPFTVGNCSHEAVTPVGLKEPFHLYSRQEKVITKMLAIEDGQRRFEEVEMNEFEMPGSAGLSLIAKASREVRLRGGVIADAIGAGKTVISIAIILQRISQARASRQAPRKSGASLVVVPPGLIAQWESEIQKFTSGLKVLKLYDFGDFQKKSASDIVNADVVICPIDILESDGYLSNLFRKSGLTKYCESMPVLPSRTGQIEQNAARGQWIPWSSQDPYGGANNPQNQKRRDQSAYYTVAYDEAIEALRKMEFSSNQKGVPIEYYEFERVFVDEIHESLCTTKGEMDDAKEHYEETGSGFFKEKNRRAGRELLGIAQRDPRRRPLVCRRGMFGLTGTPLLDSSSRVIELANLMGAVYVIGLSSHWRKLERESGRDIFLQRLLEPKQGREIRKTIQATCQKYLTAACCRNKSGEEMAGITLNIEIRRIRMSSEEKAAYLKSQSGIPPDKRSLAIKPEDFDASAGHDISKFLRQNSKLECRGKELVKICKEILDKDPTTKIVVFTDGKIGAGVAARDFLNASGLGCTWLDHSDSVRVKNQKISWYQTGDATEEDKKRPRVLILHFEHAAGLNLQTECYNLILFSPLYIGDGGSSSDDVADASTELQAIGRVHRPGQQRHEVNVYRIEIRGPEDEECLDGQLIRRNTAEETVEQATNAGDEAD